MLIFSYTNINRGFPDLSMHKDSIINKWKKERFSEIIYVHI